MYRILSFCILLIIILQDSIAFGKNTSVAKTNNKVGHVKADLGEDINAPGLTTIVLDASSSIPQNGSLTYEWSFPPNMIFSGEYNFSDSDSPVLYENNSNGKQSIKKLTTRDKFIEIDLPDLPGQAYEVSLRVQNHIGTEDRDAIIITIEQPLIVNNTNPFSDSLLIDSNSNNQSLINESTKNREAISETIINDDLITIQAINKGRLNPMEVRIINAYIFNFLEERGFKNVLNPNRFIPKEIKVNKLYNRTRYEQDSISTTYLDTVSMGEDLSNYNGVPIDTLLQDFRVDDTTTRAKTFFIYRQYKYNISMDTLSYTEVVDTTLKYNFDCNDYDCAAENAYLEQAGSILCWGLNDYDELEFHYFTLNSLYSGKTHHRWLSEKVILNPVSDSLLKYPQAISFDSVGSPVIVSGNNQDILFLNNNEKPISIKTRFSEVYNLDSPSALCAGRLGELYITDKSNHSVFWFYEGVMSTIYTTPRYKNGSIIPGEPTSPIAIRLNSLGEILVLFEGDGSVRKFDREGQQTVILQPGVVKNPSDIAISINDTLFVVSTSEQQVYKVRNDTKVLPFAGTQGTITTATDGALATESYLDAPVSIDFDRANRLYIADNTFGSIRVVTPDGIINTLTDEDNKIFNIYQMRINNHSLTTLYATHMLDHKLTRVRFNTYSSDSRFFYIYYPKFTIKMEGIYGLEKSISKAVESTLEGIIPKEKKSLIKRFSESNQKFTGYLKRNPLIFVILLIVLNQGISGAFSDGGPIDLPPEFPPS